MSVLVGVKNTGEEKNYKAYIPRSVFPDGPTEEKFKSACDEVGGEYDKEIGNCIVSPPSKLPLFVETLKKKLEY
jgi:hypothetical protein